MVMHIKEQGRTHLAFYILFALVSSCLMVYYFSNTLIHFTTPQQFPISSFGRFPLTFLIFPAEIFSFCFALYFIYNLFHGNHQPSPPKTLPNRKGTKVAVLIPIYNEPREIVMRTLSACNKLVWEGGVRIYMLDDSTNEPDRQNMLALSKKFGCTLVRRENRIGYKAGNINNAISKVVTEDFFVILDADQAPEPLFLEQTMDHFSDRTVGFVQTPQHFVNTDTPIERAAALGNNIFYHAQCVSKAADGAMPFCGTNVVIRVSAFCQVAGFSYYTSTEDIEMGLRMNEAGYQGIYVPQILVHGYAPTHFTAYASQQYRWANGNLAILRESWLRILLGNFSLRYQVHAFFTLGWWLIGLVNLTYVVIPILSFFFGGTHHTWLPTSLLILLFFNVLLGLAMIFAALHSRIEGEKVTVADAFLQYSLITNSMFIYAGAAFAALARKYAGFVRTDKRRASTGIREIRPNLLLAAVCFCFSILALYHSSIASDVQQLRTYLPISIWLLFYSVILSSSLLFVDGRSTKVPHAIEATAKASSGASSGAQAPYRSGATA